MAGDAKVKCMTLVPYILSPDCKKHTGWLTAVFDAQVGKDMSLSEDGTNVMHCVVNIAGNKMYMSDRCVPTNRGTGNEKPFGFMCHFNMTNDDDARAVWKNALDNGAKVVQDLKLQFWGAMCGVFVDPFGYSWGIHVCPRNRTKAEP